MAYIHREKFLKKCAEAFGSFGILIKAIEEISNESISADVVEVVRCKDCKFFIPDAELDHNEYPNIIEADGLCDCSLKLTDADDFCSHGERKVVTP